MKNESVLSVFSNEIIFIHNSDFLNLRKSIFILHLNPSSGIDFLMEFDNQFFIYLLEGAIQISLEEVECTLKANSFIYLRKNERFRFKNIKGDVAKILVFSLGGKIDQYLEAVSLRVHSIVKDSKSLLEINERFNVKMI